MSSGTGKRMKVSARRDDAFYASDLKIILRTTVLSTTEVVILLPKENLSRDILQSSTLDI